MNNKKETTLEEAALNFAITIQTKEGTVSRLNAIEWFKAGAKEQAERMYSEKEVYSILEQAMKDCYRYELEEHYSGDYRNLKEWFEQFKKK